MSKIRNGIDIDALTKELDELCDEVTPSEVMLRIYSVERDHQTHVLEAYYRFVAQVEAYFDVLVTAVHHTNYVEKLSWPPHKSMQILLIVHNLKPMLSGFDRLMKGYYEDALALLRVSYEAFFRILFISLNPDDPHHSFAPKKPGLKQFQLTNFINQELKLNWSSYHVMSSIAHANQFNAVSELVKLHKEGQKDLITLAFKFDENMFSMGMNNLHILLLLYLRAVLTLFLAYGQQEADVEIVETCRKHISLCQQSVAAHINPHIQVMAKDIDDMFLMLADVEKGHDWRSTWKKLREP